MQSMTNYIAQAILYAIQRIIVLCNIDLSRTYLAHHAITVIVITIKHSMPLQGGQREL